MHRVSKPAASDVIAVPPNAEIPPQSPRRMLSSARAMVDKPGKVLSLLLLLMTCASASWFASEVRAATLAPSLQVGLNWLTAQVRSDGSMQNEGAAMTLPLPSREETLVTLGLLAGAVPSPLATAISGNTDTNLEFVARRVMSDAAAGFSTATDVATLLAAQNADGGWGLGNSYASNPLDTALVLIALRATNVSATTPAASAIAYLDGAMSTDGGWGVDGASSVYIDSNVLLAANGWPGSTASNIIARASAWLLVARNTAGSYGNTFDNSFALLALATQPSQSSALPPLVAAIDVNQLGDGSWADDPYLTAIALRARWYSTQTSTTPTAGGVQGTIIDQSTSQPLAGADVRVVQNTALHTTSASDGSFNLASVPPGSSTLQFSLQGYQTRSISIATAANQQLNVGAISLLPLPTTANLSGVVKSDTGAPLQNVTVSAGARSTLTDATGAYSLAGLSPGATTVTATLSGYQTVTTSVLCVAGTSYLFSPTLYPTNVAVPATSLKGIIVDADTRAPIAGASVTSNGTTTVSVADGSFAFANAALGAFALHVSATGYQSITSSGSLVAGVNDVGAIALQRAASATTLQGKVLDDNGAPIANATLAIDGGPTTASGSDGSYVLTPLIGNTFALHVAATGFIAQSFDFAVSTPGTYTQDFHLVAQQTNALTLGALTVVPASAGANADISVGSTLINGGSAEFDGVLLLEVYDGSGNLIGSGSLSDGAGFGLGAISLLPGAHQAIVGHWNTGLFAPGTYSFELRLVQPQSISRSTPLGTLVLNRTAPLTITATTHFVGTVAGDPPAIQAGLNQSVHLTALIKNDGNGIFAGRQLTLTAIDATNGTTGFTANAVLSDLPLNAVANVDFGSWLPPGGGNYQLQVIAADPALGKALGTLYVGNVAQAAFTVTPSDVLSGTSIVKGNIHVSGVNPAQATITDPLAPLIRTATQTAISYNDRAAHTWIDTNRCSSCHIGNQALIGGELTRSLTTFDTFDRNTILNNVATNQASDGGLTQGYCCSYYRRLGSLSLWGLLGYHNLAEYQTVLKRAADWIVAFQASNGNWSSDYNSAWFDNDISMSMLNLSNLSRVDTFLKNNSLASVPDYSVGTLLPNVPGSSRGYLAAVKSGDLFYTDAGSISRIKTDGTVVMQWTTLSDPRNIVERNDGSIWAATGNGTYLLNGDGTATLLAPGNFEQIAIDDSGGVWGEINGSPTIYQLDDSGNATAWLTTAPWGWIARINTDSDGSLLITDASKPFIYRVAPDKTISVAVEMMQGAASPPVLIYLLKDADHWLLSTTNGIYRFSSTWEGQRITWTGRADQMTHLPDGSVAYVGYQQTGIFKLVPGSEAVAPSLAQYENAISIGADWLQQQNLGPSDTLHIAQQLWGLGEAYRFYQTTNIGRATTLHTAMTTLATQIRANQNPDGGWGRYVGYGSDALVTAQVGIALDYTEPSANDPVIRAAVAWLLSQQQPDGSWASANGIMSTHESTTTMVAIWLPTILDRLGSIDAQVSVTFPRSIQASFANTAAPDTRVTDAHGNVTATWALTGVTNAGRDLGFDLTLIDMATNEVRPAAVDAHMIFQNSFTATNQNMPIAVPNVTAAAPVDLGVTTDKPEYPANATAQITTTLVNRDNGEIDGTLVVDVVDTGGVLVGSVTSQAVSLAAGATLSVVKPFAIGTILPAQYTVTAVLSNAGGTIAQAKTTFNVLPDGVASSAISTVRTDRQVYNASDHVLILSKALNQSANIVLDDLTLAIDVVDAGNISLFTHNFAIDQLLPAASSDFSTVQLLANAAPGTYTVKQDLLDSSKRLYNHVETTYTVRSTGDTGFGLVGAIAATPKTIRPGEALALASNATNQGNATLADLPLTIYLVDPDLGTVVQEFHQTATVAQGASVPFNTPWTAQGRVGATYLAVLVAAIGQGANATSLTLAEDNFTLQAPIAAGIQATGGTPQGATITTPYSVPLQATVRDTASNPLANVTVTFVAPTSGASASFANGNSAVTDANGNASVAIVANGTVGPFTISATAPDVVSTAQFALQNVTAPAANIVASGGTPQTGDTGALLPTPLQATVTDTLGNPVASIVVTFIAPSSGASVTFPSGNTAVTNTQGQASVSAFGNSIAGVVSVTATAPGIAGTASFSLTLQQSVCNTLPPDAFTFPSQTGVAPNTLVYSNTISVSGLACPASIWISNGEFSINGGAWLGATAASDTSHATIALPLVNNGDRVQLRILSPSTVGATATAILHIGSGSAAFVIAAAGAAPVAVPFDRTLWLILIALLVCSAAAVHLGWLRRRTTRTTDAGSVT